MKWVKQDGEEEEQWRIGLPDTRRATFVKSPLLILCLSFKESPSLIIHIITTTLSPLTALSLYIYIPTQLNVLLICVAWWSMHSNSIRTRISLSISRWRMTPYGSVSSVNYPCRGGFFKHRSEEDRGEKINKYVTQSQHVHKYWTCLWATV